MISHKYLTSVLVFLCVISNSLLKELPDYIQPCKRDPSTLDSCILGAIEALKPQLMIGIKEIDVPAIEPLLISEIKVLSPGSIPLHASAQNVKVTGAGDFKIKSLTVDMADGQTLTIKVRILFRKLHFEGDYKMDTQLLLLPVVGQGKLNADAVKCDAEVVLHAQIISQDGTDYLKFDKIDTNINVKDYSIKLDGLFNGDKNLGDATNAAINQNRGEFLKATKPHLEKTVSQLVLGVANKIVNGLTLDQLLPKP